jgi:hypothetical protein
MADGSRLGLQHAVLNLMARRRVDMPAKIGRFTFPFAGKKRNQQKNKIARNADQLLAL